MYIDSYKKKMGHQFIKIFFSFVNQVLQQFLITQRRELEVSNKYSFFRTINSCIQSSSQTTAKLYDPLQYFGGGSYVYVDSEPRLWTMILMCVCVLFFVLQNKYLIQYGT